MFKNYVDTGSLGKSQASYVRCVIACRPWHVLQFGKVHISSCTLFLKIKQIALLGNYILHLDAKFLL